MFLHRSLGTVMLAGTALAVSGCLNANDSSSDAAVGSDEEGIQNVIFEEMSDYADPDVRWYDDGTDLANAPINTERWRREVLGFVRNASIEIERTDGKRWLRLTGEVFSICGCARRNSCTTPRTSTTSESAR